MPISVQYGADPALVGRAAYEGGLGRGQRWAAEYRQRWDLAQLQAQQAANQQSAQIRAQRESQERQAQQQQAMAEQQYRQRWAMGRQEAAVQAERDRFAAGRQEARDVFAANQQAGRDQFQAGRQEARDVWQSGRQEARDVWQVGVQQAESERQMQARSAELAQDRAMRERQSAKDAEMRWGLAQFEAGNQEARDYRAADLQGQRDWEQAGYQAERDVRQHEATRELNAENKAAAYEQAMLGQVGSFAQAELGYDKAIGLENKRNAFSVQENRLQNVNATISEIRKAYAKAELTPEGQRAKAEKFSKLGAIERAVASNKLRPEQELALKGQWLEEFSKAGLEHHVKQPPTSDELMEANVRPHKVTGELLQLTYDAHGHPEWKPLGTPPKAAAGKETAAPVFDTKGAIERSMKLGIVKGLDADGNEVELFDEDRVRKAYNLEKKLFEEEQNRKFQSEGLPGAINAIRDWLPGPTYLPSRDAAPPVDTKAIEARVAQINSDLTQWAAVLQPYYNAGIRNERVANAEREYLKLTAERDQLMRGVPQAAGQQAPAGPKVPYTPRPPEPPPREADGWRESWSPEASPPVGQRGSQGQPPVPTTPPPAPPVAPPVTPPPPVAPKSDTVAQTAPQSAQAAADRQAYEQQGYEDDGFITVPDLSAPRAPAVMTAADKDKGMAIVMGLQNQVYKIMNGRKLDQLTPVEQQKVRALVDRRKAELDKIRGKQ